MAAALPRRLRVIGLAGGGLECGGGGSVHVIEVDFFDEADPQLVVDKEDLIGGVHSRAQMLAHPPKAQITEDGEGRSWSGVCCVGLEDFRPDHVKAVEGGAAV